MLQRCSMSPGMACASNVGTPGTSADEISSYAPTTRSIRVTGRCDQKFAPRREWSAVMRISVVGAGTWPGASGIVQRTDLLEHAPDVVREHDREVVRLEQRNRAVDRVE